MRLAVLPEQEHGENGGQQKQGQNSGHDANEGGVVGAGSFHKEASFLYAGCEYLYFSTEFQLCKPNFKIMRDFRRNMGMRKIRGKSLRNH